jgi:hypothetical protein
MLATIALIIVPLIATVALAFTVWAERRLLPPDARTRR